MEHILKLQVYHGTDFEIAQKICTEEFICKKSLEHWLGNGIYFYLDKSLAKWWTTNPSKKFGTKIKEPVIIECDLEVNDKNILDITKIEGYNNYVEVFHYYFDNYFFKKSPATETDIRRLRCAFFDWVMETQEIDVIIAPFQLPEQPYRKESNKKNVKDLILNEFEISYAEVQVCLKPDKQHLLSNKRIERI